MLNKKAQGMSTNTIVLLILGLVILVILIVGFSTGWNTFQNIASPTNVDSLKEDCNSACALNQVYSFCSADRTLRVNEENFKVKTSCEVLAGVNEFSKYNFEECPGIVCELSCGDVKMNDKAGSYTGEYDISSIVTEDNCFLSA